MSTYTPEPGDTADDGLQAILVENDVAIYALKLIAKGRKDCGRPVAAETARQIARETLDALGENWT